jgi:hypothetical protein
MKVRNGKNVFMEGRLDIGNLEFCVLVQGLRKKQARQSAKAAEIAKPGHVEAVKKGPSPLAKVAALTVVGIAGSYFLAMWALGVLAR